MRMHIRKAAEITPYLTLVHICCAPDAAYGVRKISEAYGRVTGFFYNPNIWPLAEYDKRLEEMVKLTPHMPFDFIEGDRNRDVWVMRIRGLEGEPERGKRCKICIRLRLEESVKMAKNIKADAFTTVLTVSPHKDADMVNQAGRELGEQYGLPFIDLDLKKKDGFKNSIALSKKYGIYRQNYCGCEYSLKK